MGELPSVTVVQAEFERWAACSTPFQSLISAQAWHWIDPEIRYAKAREVLKQGGAIAVFWSHANWTAAALGPALDQAYREAVPELAPSGPMHPRTRQGDLVPDWEAEIDGAAGFERPEVRSFAWRDVYAADEYVRLLSTHSDHIVLEPAVQAGLYERVAGVIDEHGGRIEVPYVTRLCLARAA
jgi:hypothetical protein